METVTIKGYIWFQTETGLRIDEGRVKLLERTDLSGSISEAVRQLEIPCRRAWGMVCEMNNSAKEPLIIKEVGGKDGGRSILAKEGKKTVALFKKADQYFRNFSKGESYHLSRGQK